MNASLTFRNETVFKLVVSKRVAMICQTCVDGWILSGERYKFQLFVTI